MGGGRGPGGAGAARGAGGGDRGGDDLGRVLEALRQQNAQQQRLLQALAGGGDGGRGPRARQQRGGGAAYSPTGASGTANAGGGWRRGGGQGGGGSARGRPGDWTCPECGAYPCFAATSRCFRCRAPRRDRPGGDGAASATRPSTQGGGGGGTGRLASRADPSAYLGPVGAGGSRPLLGGRANGGGKADTAPSYRVPGASAAARTEEARAQRAPATTAEPRGGANENVGVDDKEFQPVQKGRGANPAECQGGGPKPTIPISKSWAALAEEDDDDDNCDIDDGDGGCGDADDNDGADWDDSLEPGAADGQVADEIPEAQLKSLWLSHCAAVKTLERDKSVLPEVLASVKQQRDAAERRWKAAKSPHPLHKRLRWAENDVRAAAAKEASRRRELELHLEQAAARTKEIEERLAVDIARTQRKRDALAAIQREASFGSCAGTERAARAAVEGIASDIGPSLAAIIEKLGDGDETIRQDLQVLSTSLGRVEGVLREAAEAQLAAREPECFDIGGGDDKGDGDLGGQDGMHDDIGDGSCNGGRRVQARTANIASAPRWTQPAANAPWRRLSSSQAAVEEARKMLRVGTGGDTGSGTGTATSAETNDLAIAERRRQLEAQAQFAAAIDRRQAVQADPMQAQEEERMRAQREQAQRDEMLRHQNAAAKAAADAEAEAVRQREALWASLSPAEREAAIKVRNQQAAVGAHVFGTQEASQLAGLVHQAHVHDRTGADANAEAAEVDLLMQMSPEEFARWDNERQSLL